jgi:hypothetical protein
MTDPAPYRDERSSTAASLQRLEEENAGLRRARASFSTLDWMGFTVTALALSWLAYFALVARPAFLHMFADLGSGTDLPAVTRLVGRPWFAPAIATLPAGLLVAAALGRGSVGVRRALVVAAFLLVGAEIGFCVWAMYRPIFDLAGSIKAD